MEINALSDEMLHAILEHLCCCHLRKCSAVCGRWRRAALDPYLFHRGKLCVTRHENPTVGAALQGHIKCLAYYQRCASQRPQLGWTQETVAAAAHGGHIACLDYLATQRSTDEDWRVVATAAASQGRLECLEYATTRVQDKHEQGAVYAAIAGSHTDCVLYLVTKTQMWLRDIISLIVCLGHVDMLRRISSVCNATTEWGVAKIYASDACTIAAYRGDIQMLRFLHSIGVACRQYAVCAAAAESGSVECLMFVRKNGCTCRVWDETTCEAAARHGNLECLRYACENGCPLSDRILYEAASHGHMDCVEYALDHGCAIRTTGSVRSIKVLAKMNFGS